MSRDPDDYDFEVAIIEKETGEVVRVEKASGERAVQAERVRAAAILADLDDREREVRRLGRRVKALEDELRLQRDEAPEAQTAKAIFRFWVDRTGRDPKRTKFGDKRQGVVLARLREGHSPERIMRAVDWVAMRPYVTDGGRTATGAPTQKFDDLELVCRNEVNVEKFARLADAIDPGGGLAESMPQGV